MQMKNSQCKLGILKNQRIMFHIISIFPLNMKNLEQFTNLELQKRRNS